MTISGVKTQVDLTMNKIGQIEGKNPGNGRFVIFSSPFSEIYKPVLILIFRHTLDVVMI